MTASRTQDSSQRTRNLKALVLLVTDVDAPSGGIQKNSRILLQALHVRGVTTYACVRNYHRRPRVEVIDGTIFHRSPVFGRGLAVSGVLYFLSTFLWLIRHRASYQVVHCQQMFGPTMVASVASFFTRKPILTRVTTVGDLGEVKQIREMPLSGVRLRLIRRVSSWAALTTAMKSELISLGIAQEKIRIIPNSTEIPAEAGYLTETKERLRRELGLSFEKIVIFVGRLSEEKNLDLLIKGWSQVLHAFPAAHLLLLGSGGAYRNVEDSLRRVVAERDLGRTVHFLGHIERAKDYIMASDVFVLPSRTEGMSNSLVEALACGAAIVATNIPGNAEICTDRENALLVPVGDMAALAQAITELLGSPVLAAQLGHGARKKAENELSVDRMVATYVDAYEELIASGP